MDIQTARFVARVFVDLFDLDASTFRLPARKVPEGQDAPPVRYAVIVAGANGSEDTVIASVRACKDIVNPVVEGGGMSKGGETFARLISESIERDPYFIARGVRAAWEASVGVAPCMCPTCMLALAVVTTLGIDAIARMEPGSISDEASACAERWGAALGDDQLTENLETYRALAAAFRAKFPR